MKQKKKQDKIKQNKAKKIKTHQDVEDIIRVIKKQINTHIGSGQEIASEEMRIRKAICKSCEIKMNACRNIKLGLISMCSLNNIKYRLEIIRRRYKEIKRREDENEIFRNNRTH